MSRPANMDEKKDHDGRLLEELKELRERLSALKRAEAEDRKAEVSLEARALYWAAASAIGQSAVAGRSLPALMDEVVARVARTLDVEFSSILELLPDGQALLVRAGVGWREGVVGRTTVPVRTGSQAGYTLISAAPVVVHDLPSETRFHLSPVLHQHHVKSGMSVVIRGHDRPFGVLAAHTGTRRVFSKVDVDFLEAVANMLAAAIDRMRSEDALRESERRFRDLVESVQLAAVMINPRGHVIFCNDFLLRLTGFRREEVVGRSWFKTFLPARVQRVAQRIFDETIQSGSMPVHHENTIQTRSGELRQIAWNSTLLRDMQDNVTGAMSLGEDVTDRRNAEQVLRESEERYRLLFDSNPEAMWVVDSSTLGFLAVNEAAVRRYAYSRDEFLSMTLEEIRPPEDVPHLLETFGEDQPGIRTPGVFRHRKKDGAIFDVEITTHSIVFGGKPARLVLAKDVTARRRAEAALSKEHALLQLLLAVAAAANASPNPEDAMQVCLDRICAFTGCPVGHVYLQGAGGAGDLAPTAIWHLDDVRKFEPFRRATMASRLPAGAGLPGRVLSSGRAAWIADVTTDKSFPRSQPAIDAGVRAGFGFPILVGKEVAGVIEFYATEAREPDEPLLEVMEQIGAQIGRAVERKRAEAALADETERLAVTLRSIGDAVITTDTAGRIVLLNRIAEALTGWSQEEAAGRPLSEIVRIVDERTREPRRAPTEEALERRERSLLPEQTLLAGRDGRERFVAGSASPILDVGGGAIGSVLVFRDVTDKRRTEEELLKASKLESVGVLAGGIAHDFNNILTAVLGNILLLKTSLAPGDPSAQRLLEAEGACLRAKDLTKQLLTFSKGGDPVTRASSMADLIQDAAGFALRGANVRCEFSFSPDLWPAEVDEGQMRQVINDLVINAMQAMPAGGTIRIRGSNVALGAEAAANGHPLAPGRYVEIAIEDQGVGIKPENLARIFDPYFTTKPKGSGLGLAIAYSVITKHEGRISAESKVGRGSTFRLLLPASDRRPRVASTAAVDPGPTPSRARVLVMDDEEMIKEVTGGMLHHFGYDSDFAGDGAEAITLYENARAAGRPYDAVILDLTVPGGMGGQETIRRLRGIDPEVRAIVASGYSNDPIMADFRNYGFSGMVSKPFTLDDLKEALSSVLGRRRG